MLRYVVLECKNQSPQLDAVCAQKAAANQCVTDPVYMYSYCRKACLRCDSYGHGHSTFICTMATNAFGHSTILIK
jgi:hypothetical protein